MKTYWLKEIDNWLNIMGTPEMFIKEYFGACASYNWKQLSIQKAIERWPESKNKLEQLLGKN